MAAAGSDAGAVLDRVLMRLISAKEDQLSGILDKLLPRLLSALGDAAQRPRRPAPSGSASPGPPASQA